MHHETCGDESHATRELSREKAIDEINNDQKRQDETSKQRGAGKQANEQPSLVVPARGAHRQRERERDTRRERERERRTC